MEEGKNQKQAQLTSDGKYWNQMHVIDVGGEPVVYFLFYNEPALAI